MALHDTGDVFPALFPLTYLFDLFPITLPYIHPSARLLPHGNCFWQRRNITGLKSELCDTAVRHAVPKPWPRAVLLPFTNVLTLSALAREHPAHRVCFLPPPIRLVAERRISLGRAVLRQLVQQGLQPLGLDCGVR